MVITAAPARESAPAHLPPGRRRTHLRRRTAINYALVAPALVLSIVIVVVPGILTLLFAFTDWSGVGFDVHFVGGKNFASILSDPVFATALTNNIKWLVMFLTLPAVIGLLTAMLLLRRKRLRTFYQVIYLMPYVLAPVVNALVWQTIIYNPHGGVAGLLGIQPPTGSTSTALYAAAAVDMWHYWGFLTVVYLGAIRQTPVDQVEAAIVDGAGGWGVFRNVYLPSIRPTLLLMGVMTVIFSFLAFDYVFLLTQGGPAHASEVMGTYAYAFAFSSFEFGKAAAVGIIMSFFGLLASVLYTWISRREIAR
ncbi:raffinose/stachyose/melibiose transport system permease protein [Kribbella aluminosa]|uniref:Raffinose/stachyose/melibiose transport system permease protein n=1 Tax=Kribbella aluminosa TaxID=416017 RepID=A0ABS4UCD0_9ACTN|nr:sugar ABC transporter permease [Kribbella aluminosa]MBP2349297.1 raffinose/stachyose/melibiose transport system permease protein [Kribbella aluminosa]